MSSLPARWLRKRRRRIWDWITLSPMQMILSATITLAILTGTGITAYIWKSHGGQCGAGVQQHGSAGECIGVSDGSFVFAPQLSSAEKAIARENNAINSRKHATIALLLPLTAPDPEAEAEVLYEIQGAYVAQYRANHDQNGQVPPIRLVLANPGLNSAEWPTVVRQLKTMTGPPNNLLAVVGIGISTNTTKAEVRQLTQEGIPVVGGAISGGGITNSARGDRKFPGLARVSATSDQEATALAHFGAVNPRQALLIEDTRTDDDYITTLKSAFTAHLAGGRLEPFQFQSPPDITQDGSTANQFAQMVPNICDAHVKWIYFAGRQVQLRQFINELGKRGCQYEKFTILTGSAASHLSIDPRLNTSVFGTGITLDYTAIAHPGAWTTDPPPTGGSHADYQAFASALARTATYPAGPIGPVDLIDGEAMINYDAAWTAITAIRKTTTPATSMPSVQDVKNEWPLLSGVNKVTGATGWICLDNAGNPYDKAVPIVRYGSNGRPVFVALAWPTGAPPAASCTIPPGG